MSLRALQLVVLAIGFHLAAAPLIAQTETRNVFLITLDGVRWQEVFSGAEAALISKAGGVSDTNRLGKDFWRNTPEERRAALMPFFWNTIARQGQLFGNQHRGSIARVTNGRNFTYPGFNEILTGFADDRIDKNAKILNANTTVLEWLNQKSSFKDKVAAFANWDVFPYILNAERAGIPIWTGYKEGSLHHESLKQITAMIEGITPVWPDMNFDVFFHEAALAYVRAKRPRVVWIAYSETDEWAHEARYDLYLRSAQRIDRYVSELWNAVQSMPAYRNRTAFILTTDHGRGTGLEAWKSHGEKVAGAEGLWIAAIGPGVSSLGERQNVPEVRQNQIAATIAAWLGEKYEGVNKTAGEPIHDLVRSRP